MMYKQFGSVVLCFVVLAISMPASISASIRRAWLSKYAGYEVLGEYDYTPKDKVVTVTNVTRTPSIATILATGERLDFETGGKTLSFTIPAERTTSLLDVIKVQW